MSNPYADRVVTEQDFRAPEFRNAKVEDYEFRADGKLVRKDRWESAIFSIASAVGLNTRGGFEIPDVVEKVLRAAELSGMSPDWVQVADDLPNTGTPVALKLKDGSILLGAQYQRAPKSVGAWEWRGMRLDAEDAESWHELVN